MEEIDWDTNQKEFESIISHELAHIVSGDVWKTRLSQCLSTATIIVGLIYISLILISLASVPWAKSELFFSFIFYFPLFLVIGFLAYFNIMLLREREFVADYIASKSMGATMHLRNAIQVARGLVEESIHSSPVRLNRWRIRNLFKLRFHPTTKSRNLYLFDQRFYISPKQSYIFAAGFVSIFCVESALRAVRLTPYGTGIAPLLSVQLDTLIGVISLAVFLFPIIIYCANYKVKTIRIPIVNLTLVSTLVWATGAILGAFASSVVIDPLLLKETSIWSIISTYGWYTPIEAIIVLVICWIILNLLQDQRVIFRSIKNDIRTFYFPLVVGFMPIMIWYLFYMGAFEHIDIFRFKAPEMRTALGVIFVYFGLGGLIIASAYKNSRIYQQRSETSKNYYPPILSASPQFNKLLYSKWLWLVLIPLWISGFRISQYYRYPIDTHIAQMKNQSITLPTGDSPEGFVRHNDSHLGASIIYPVGWIPVKSNTSSLSIATFYNPEKVQKIRFISYPRNTYNSPEDFLALSTVSLMGSDVEPDYLMDYAIPITIPTKIGNATGLYVKYVSPIDQNLIISAYIKLPIMSYGVVYSFYVLCERNDVVECKNLFDVFSSHFDILSQSLGLSEEYATQNFYRDSDHSFEFSFPLPYEIVSIKKTEGIHDQNNSSDSGFIDQQLLYEKRIGIDNMTISDDSRVYFTHYIYENEINLADRIELLRNTFSQSSYVISFEVLTQLDYLYRNQEYPYLSYIMETETGDEIVGNIFMFNIKNQIFEIITTCDQSVNEMCEETIDTILSTFDQ